MSAVRLLEEDAKEVKGLGEEEVDDLFVTELMPLLSKQRATTLSLTPDSEQKTADSAVKLVEWLKERRSLRSSHQL